MSDNWKVLAFVAFLFYMFVLDILLSSSPPSLSPPFTLFWVKGPLGPLALLSLQTSNIPLNHVFTLAPTHPPPLNACIHRKHNFVNIFYRRLFLISSIAVDFHTKLVFGCQCQPPASGRWAPHTTSQNLSDTTETILDHSSEKYLLR